MLGPGTALEQQKKVIQTFPLTGLSASQCRSMRIEWNCVGKSRVFAFETDEKNDSAVGCPGYALFIWAATEIPG